MANEKRVRADLAAGALSADLTTGSTTMQSAGLADLPAITSAEHAAITLLTRDGDGRVTAKEIVYVTAHTAGATSGTIARGKEGTADPGTTWPTGTKWVHAPTRKDFDGDGGGDGLIGLKVYNPTSATTKTATGVGQANITDLDTTNLVVTFTAPPSGHVLIKLAALCAQGTNGVGYHWAVRDGSTTKAAAYVTASNAANRPHCVLEVTGLTPGTSYTYKWAAYVESASTGSLFAGSTATVPDRPAVMEVWAVNV